MVPSAPALTPVASDEEDDDLPRPGKVWDNSGPSLTDLLKSRSSTPPPPSAPPPARPDNFETVDERRLPDIWKNVLESFRRNQPGLYGALHNTTLGKVTDGQATVVFDAKAQFFAKQLEKDGKRDKVADALSEALGSRVGVRIVVKPDAAPAAPPPAEEARPKVTRPTLKDIEEMSRNAPPLSLGTSSPHGSASTTSPVAPTSLPGPQQIKLTDDLLEELKQDDLLRSLLEGLGGQIVKVVEE